MRAQHLVLFWGQRFAPLVVGLVYGELCVGFHLIHSGAGAVQPAERGTQPERDPGDEKELPPARHD
jgi:hypothetical protein